MDTNVRSEIVGHAIRWAMNILVEVISNHGRFMPSNARDEMASAVRSLGNAQHMLMQGVLSVGVVDVKKK